MNNFLNIKTLLEKSSSNWYSKYYRRKNIPRVPNHILNMKEERATSTETALPLMVRYYIINI